MRAGLMVPGGIGQECLATPCYHSPVTSGYIPELLPISPLTDAVRILASGMFQGDVSHLPL